MLCWQSSFVVSKHSRVNARGVARRIGRATCWLLCDGGRKGGCRAAPGASRDHPQSPRHSVFKRQPDGHFGRARKF